MLLFCCVIRKWCHPGRKRVHQVLLEGHVNVEDPSSSCSTGVCLLVSCCLISHLSEVNVTCAGFSVWGGGVFIHSCCYLYTPLSGECTWSSYLRRGRSGSFLCRTGSRWHSRPHSDPEPAQRSKVRLFTCLHMWIQVSLFHTCRKWSAHTWTQSDSTPVC